MNVETGEVKLLEDIPLSQMEAEGGFWCQVPKSHEKEAQEAMDKDEPIDLEGNSGWAMFSKVKRIKFRHLKRTLK